MYSKYNILPVKVSPLLFWFWKEEQLIVQPAISGLTWKIGSSPKLCSRVNPRQPLILSMKKPVIQQRFKILLLLYVNALPVHKTINTMFFYKSMRNFSRKQITYAHTAITHLLQCHSAPDLGLQTIMQVDHTLHISLVYIYQHRESCITLKHQNWFRKYLIRNVHIKDSKNV